MTNDDNNNDDNNNNNNCESKKVKKRKKKEELNNSRSNESDQSSNFRKGPWTPEEDEILYEYVSENGEGNWNAVQKNSGLNRCGKSCRLRWSNHLRPNLRKGSFTEDEERLIVERHAALGNKWAKIALELPGRTDNEIKNFWHTRLKKLQRAGLPVYPEHVLQKVRESGQENQNAGALQTANTSDSNTQPDHFEIPPIFFKNFESTRSFKSYPAIFPATRLLETTALSPPNYCSTLPPVLPVNPPSESETEFSGMRPCVSNNELLNLPLQNIINSSTNLQGSGHDHAFLRDNSPAPELFFRATKPELPSLQYSGSQPSNRQTTPSPQTLIASINTLKESPLAENSGLLEDIVYASQTRKNPNEHTTNRAAADASVTPSNAEEISSRNPHETQREMHTTSISGTGSDFEPELANQVSTQNTEENEDSDKSFLDEYIFTEERINELLQIFPKSGSSGETSPKK